MQKSNDESSILFHEMIQSLYVKLNISLSCPSGRAWNRSEQRSPLLILGLPWANMVHGPSVEPASSTRPNLKAPQSRWEAKGYLLAIQDMWWLPRLRTRWACGAPRPQCRLPLSGCNLPPPWTATRWKEWAFSNGNIR